MRDVWGYGILAHLDGMTYFIGLDADAAERGEESEFNGVFEIVDLAGEHDWQPSHLDAPQTGEFYFCQEHSDDILRDPHGAWFCDSTEDEQDIAIAAIRTFENNRVIN